MKGIPCSQAVRLNMFRKFSFDKRQNDLEGWHKERGYGEKIIRKEVLQARSYLRKELLEKKPRETKQQKLTLTITGYPFSRMWKKSSKIYIFYLHPLSPMS